MVDVKQAVAKANEFIGILYPESLPDLMLEEVRHSEDDKYWLITLGFTRSLPAPHSPLLGGLVSKSVRRDYKVIKVDAESGEPLEMLVREMSVSE
jgi:hypothetical protein